MDSATAWQVQALAQISDLLAEDPDARAVVLCGSLADPAVRADAWSDVDLKVILADSALERYFPTTDWLAPLGQLLGAEKHASGLTKTLRVCLEGFRRFDLELIPESALRRPAEWDHNPFFPAYRVVWSRLLDLEARMAALPLPGAYQDLPDAEIEPLVEAFWFKAAAAVAKVARSDLLVGMHLALGLTQDCLVLQMIRRDRKRRTSIHRSGGWGNEITNRFFWDGRDGSETGILRMIRVSCEVLDELAADLLPGYHPRCPLLLPTIEAVKQAREPRTD